jgi:eukaryotic-like serine/threonine-protein kinase
MSPFLAQKKPDILISTKKMVAQARIADRYELKDILGEGGMGVVYRAFDVKTKSLVALKTMRDVSDPLAVELFSKEWSVLASISHPNIVDIRDVGEIEERGQKKPFFVMPLLPGSTLAKLIETSSARLTVDRVVGIITQVCRGLQAAHEQGLVHRDIKPSNIFVMEDDTAKIIDFGVAHLAGAYSVTGQKGTWQYMAPEQIDMKPVTPVSDVFSLGVVCYETLTNRKPFACKTAAETAEAVRTRIAPPIFEINPAVSQAISMVIHKAMAKQPIHRLSSARDFAESLQKAFHNQQNERFDRARIQPRIERARKALSEGDSEFASEILTELEAEGHIDSEISLLRNKINQTVRQKKIRQLLESARTRVEQDEIPLALEKLIEVLEIDPENADALSMRSSIEKQRNERQIESWMALARRHLERHDFSEAKQALTEALKIRPADTNARELLQQAEHREQDAVRTRAEIDQLYGSAVNAYHSGEISTALGKLERLLEIGRQVPDAAVPDRDALYQSLYKEVRSEHDSIHNAYEDARRQLAEKNHARALEICDEYLNRYPSDPVFQALKLEAAELRRQDLSEFIFDVGRRVDAEPDLDRKVNILKEACERYPSEQQFQQALKLTRERRDLVLSIVAKARHYEEKNLFTEALGQWDTLRKIYPRYPGIDVEVDQLMKRRDRQAKEESKARLVDQVARLLDQGDFSRALDLVASARVEEPQDPELAGLERLARQGLDRSTEAQRICEQAQALFDQRKFADAVEILHGAQRLDPKNPAIRGVLVNALVEQARPMVDGENWQAAESLLAEAAELDAAHPGARALRTTISDLKRKEFVPHCLAEARDLQATGNIEAALSKVETGISQYPNDNRLLQQQTALQNLLREQSNRRERAGDLGALKEMRQQIGQAAPTMDLGSIFERSQTILQKYPDDPEIGPLAAEIHHRAGADQPPASSPQIPGSAIASGAAVVLPQRAPEGQALSQTPIPGTPKVKQSPYVFKPGRGFYATVAAVLVVLIAAAVAVTYLRNRKSQPPSSAAVTNVPVTIHTSPADATVIVNGETKSGTVDLASNARYDIVVSRVGYVTYRELGKRADRDWNFSLEPEPLRLAFSTSAKTGKVLIDGNERVALQDGAVQDLELSPDGAQHTVAVQDGAMEVLSFTFVAKPGEAPLVSDLKPKDLIAVGSLGNGVIVYNGGNTLRANLSGQDPQPIPPEGLRLTSANASQNEIVFDNKDLPRIPVDTGNAPSLFIGLNATKEIAYLSFRCNIETAHLKVDGLERKPVKPGTWRTLGLTPGPHKISVTADGYQNAEQQVELAKNTNTPLAIELKPIVVVPAFSTLVIERGTPGAEVTVDGAPSKVLDASGSASIEVSPGQHTIAFRKQDFENSPEISRLFVAGQEIHLGAEALLKKIEAKTPPPGHPPDGGTPVKPPPVTSKPWTIDFLFQSPEQVALDGSWWKSGAQVDYIFLKQGIIRRFNLAFSDPGKNFFGKQRKVEWVIGYVSNQDKIAYEFDGKKLTRKAVVKGKTESSSAMCQAPPGDLQFNIVIERDKISLTPASCAEDSYESTERDLTAGQIGVKPNADFIIRKPR